MYNDVVSVCSEFYTKHTNALYGQRVEWSEC